jgi:hypothetical protein
VPEEFIPKQYMKFDDLTDAYDYYCDYAKMAGFDVQMGRKSPQVQWFFFVTKRVTMIVIVSIKKGEGFYENWLQRACEGEA